MINRYLTKNEHLKLFIEQLFIKDLLIASYFLWFISGIRVGINDAFYNDFRITQVFLLLFLLIVSWYGNQSFINKIDILLFAFMIIGSLFWQQPVFMMADMLLVFLLYKVFNLLNYQRLLSKVIVFSSLTIFVLLPIALWDYIETGKYSPIWYPLPWNIRVYDSYFLVVSIFAVWFYFTEKRYRFLYLLFLFLAFLAVLLDGGRSVTLAYTTFIVIVSIFNRSARWQLIGTYVLSWLVYVTTTYAAHHDHINMRIARESSSGRYELWVNAFQCWSQHPIVGCGFYQLDGHANLSAHPHNLFIQVLTETGLIGFGFLVFVVFKIARNINWQLTQSYFVIAALLSIGIDLSLSGVHIYPITQIALLWLLVFLLKNSDFSHAQCFNYTESTSTKVERYFSLMIYLIIASIYIYIFSNTTLLADSESYTYPRFWKNGYKVF